MVSIVTHVRHSEIEEIGNAVADLSKLDPFVVPETVKETLVAIKLSHRASVTLGGVAAVGAEEMQRIADALSVSPIAQDASGDWNTGDRIGPRQPDEIAEIADVKFLFEKSNEKIIVIPHENALASADEKPLPQANYAMVLAVRILRERLQTALDGQDEVLTAVNAALDNMLEPFGAATDLAVLYQQLGSYTCRQCG